MTPIFSPPRLGIRQSRSARQVHRLLLPLSFLAAAAAHAAVINVPGDQPTIQAGVDAAQNGDTVLIADGTYSGTGNVDIDPGSKTLTIASVHGAASTVIDCGGSSADPHRGFYVSNSSASLTLSGLTVKNGYELNGSGSGIFNSGSLTLTDCTLTGNSSANPTTTSSNANSGGGLFNSGTATLTHCTIVGNAAIFGGGVYSLHGAGVSMVLINCTITGNSVAGGPFGGYGGGIYDGSTMTLTNCVLSSNSTDYAAGGFYCGSAAGATLTNCTLTGNSAPDGNGGGYIAFGTATLTNDIVYNNAGGSAYDTTATAANCDIDIQGGYPGTANINADPLFVSATDLHLKPGSPCLGAGTPSGAPAATLDGRTRPTPPSLGAFELTQTGTTHILWDNANGQAAVWNLNDPNPAATARFFGPYPGWTATAISEGPDGNVRLLWDNTNGQIAIWNLSDPNPVQTSLFYGPFAGWTAKDLAVGPDNAAHLLWDSGSFVALWNLSDPNPVQTSLFYGPFAGWTGTTIALGPNNQERLLWDNTNGQIAIWNLSDPNPVQTSLFYGPFAGWTAKDLAVGPDNAAHLLWDSGSFVAFWNLSDPNPVQTSLFYGPFAGWAGAAISIDADNQERLLWDNTDSLAALWNLSDPNPVQTSLFYGPYAGWTAVGISSAP